MKTVVIEPESLKCPWCLSKEHYKTCASETEFIHQPLGLEYYEENWFGFLIQEWTYFWDTIERDNYIIEDRYPFQLRIGPYHIKDNQAIIDLDEDRIDQLFRLYKDFQIIINGSN